MGRLALSFLLLATACGLTQPPTPRKSEAMEISARMLKQLDRVEADLHAAAGEEGTYAELVERHGHAQEIACKVTEEHVNEIHRLDVAQQRKWLEKKRNRHALAQLTPRRQLSVQR